ncbi:E3 ubiquitin-protein ligase RNF185-like [Metopolophium dirhodum]|uniref:E3 ubiquitin-protein ligase RNF185-like n=1 Tax=Metopolophium dirhodum TaxID=44670 RepID=UPI00298FB645|nr:E3 ubiquitin-protein ligase RNF185-like [Metopolophium dirhodum]XP_060874172.1 E3 ubiquitin-protein ligase RNF185-like [Metopolophium dirhodum]
MVGHRVIMRICIVCNTPIPSNTSMEQVIAECRSANCNQPCVHRWLESQNQNLCQACISVIGRNRFAPNFGSANTIDDNRNDVPPADRRTEASGGFTDFICTLGLYWTYIIIFIIILAILCAMVLISSKWGRLRERKIL